MSDRYIALSHCWGGSTPPCLTTTKTIESNKRGIRWSSLPRTFSDAIHVARELGIRYLWIDFLFILQDDDADWKVEASKMAQVYQNAYLTICATSGPDDDAGLWSRTRAPLPAQIGLRVGGCDYKAYIEMRDRKDAVHLAIKEVEKDGRTNHPLYPLLSRGLTFQERLLSPRLLHFCYRELLW